jgi:hypothetical protein
MPHALPAPLSPRPAHSGPFFDYVSEAGRQYANRLRSERARLARRDERLAESRLASAEQRWEGEGGNTGQRTAGGPA